MRTRLIINLILLLIVATLVAVVLIEPGKQEEPVVPLANVEENAVDRISLQNQESITFEKQNGRWWLASPLHAPANDTRITQLLGIAKARSEARYPIQQEDLAKFGLDKPTATLVLGNVQLSFGGSDPLGRRRYVRVADTLHLAQDNFVQYLTAPATDYVDRKLLPENAKPVEFFLPGLHAKLNPDGKWTTEPPGKPDEALHDFINAWQTARAIDVKRAEGEAKGDVIKIGLADERPVEFIIAQREPDLVLVRTDWGLQFQVTSEAAKRLLSLREKSEPDKAAPANKAAPDSPDQPQNQDQPPEPPSGPETE
jgi:hypothetical protein